MITSKMTRRSQTTIPQAVRLALNLRPGDEIAYLIEDGRVILMRAESSVAHADPFSIFSEWSGEADRNAYAAL
jgi:antitoxin PrlF